MASLETIAINDLKTENVLRYMGNRNAPGEAYIDKINECKKKFLPFLAGKVSYIVADIERPGVDTVKIEGVVFKSKALYGHLAGCDKAVLMAATVGPEADRIRMRAAVRSSMEELIFDALGTEAIECLCDKFCDIMSERLGLLTPRFSPGYGDLPLETQRDLISVLDTNRRIGLTLTDSLLMTPTKSVSAVMGIKNKKVKGEIKNG